MVAAPGNPFCIRLNTILITKGFDVFVESLCAKLYVEGKGGKVVEQQAVYANRRRIQGERGKRLLRRLGELVERPFAHCYETGAMRRTHLRGRENILKRVLVHVAGYYLGLLMCRNFGFGTARGLSELSSSILSLAA